MAPSGRTVTISVSVPRAAPLLCTILLIFWLFFRLDMQPLCHKAQRRAAGCGAKAGFTGLESIYSMLWLDSACIQQVVQCTRTDPCPLTCLPHGFVTNICWEDAASPQCLLSSRLLSVQSTCLVMPGVPQALCSAFFRSLRGAVLKSGLGNCSEAQHITVEKWKRAA